MANGKGQMANGMRFIEWQIPNHLNFAVCHLPFKMSVPTVDCLLSVQRGIDRNERFD
jgi:hypothetical protein